jgi:hypothetical protein
MAKEKLERITMFRPAYDKRHSDPKKNYGIGAVHCFMLVKGKKGAAHFSFATGMLLPSTVRDYIRDGRAKYEFIGENHEHYLNKPMGFDVGYHAKKKQWDGQELRWPTRMVKKKGYEIKPYNDKGKPPEENLKELTDNVKFVKIGKKPPVCDWIGVPCYSDGSAMEAERWMDILIEKGSDEIWKMLEKNYHDIR